MRAFWDQEPDALVGKVISDMLDVYEALCISPDREGDSSALKKSQRIVARLLGTLPENVTNASEGFLEEDFAIPNVQKLPVDLAISEIIQARLKEAQTCLNSEAYLSVIFQCGSVLEAVLLGAAQNDPKSFNRSKSSPKRNGKVKPLHEWTLSELINAAHDIGILKADVQEFSHGLRHFRNYIHPYQQVLSGFYPDEHTAKVCLQVLKAALADVSGERK